MRENCTSGSVAGAGAPGNGRPYAGCCTELLTIASSARGGETVEKYDIDPQTPLYSGHVWLELSISAARRILGASKVS
jgi:hypothetical protein